MCSSLLFPGSDAKAAGFSRRQHNQGSGLLRFPDTLSRLHAISKADNLGLGLIVLGLLPQMASIADGLKLLCIWLLAQLSAATASQLLARAVHRDRTEP